MPIDIKTEAVTISIIKNGMKITKPISKAFFNSLMTKAGTNTQVDTSSGVRGRLDLESATNSARSFSRVCLNINCRKGIWAWVKASGVLSFPCK